MIVEEDQEAEESRSRTTQEVAVVAYATAYAAAMVVVVYAAAYAAAPMVVSAESGGGRGYCDYKGWMVVANYMQIVDKSLQTIMK